MRILATEEQLNGDYDFYITTPPDADLLAKGLTRAMAVTEDVDLELVAIWNRIANVSRRARPGDDTVAIPATLSEITLLGDLALEDLLRDPTEDELDQIAGYAATWESQHAESARARMA